MSPDNTSCTRKINLVRIAHVFYTHKNIDKARQFLEDFGFHELKRVGKNTYYRGLGPEPFVYVATEGSEDKFGGTAFAVESKEDLEHASKTLPNATEVHEMNEEPGGGLRVTFKDPVDGFPFHLVYGQRPSAPLERKKSGQQDFNFPDDKLRPANKFRRFQKGPAPVQKLGHFGMCVTNFAKTYNFYTTRFNFVPSDLIYNEKGEDISTFLHLDRGAEPVDHHCFFFFQGS